MKSLTRQSLLTLLVFAAGCAADAGAEREDDFSSDQATLLDFEFDAEITTGRIYGENVERQVHDQMLYTIGHLNGERAVGRLDKLEVSNVEITALGESETLIKYHAKLPVGWGKKTDLPETYRFRVPKRITHEALGEFTNKYMHSCVDWGAHDVDQGSMWYYYRPNRGGCSIDEADVVEFEASVTKSEANTSGKYPEYDKVWEDGEFNVVAIFGKYEDGKTSPSDAGISAYNQFVRKLSEDLAGYELQTEPADVPLNPGVDLPDITFKATLKDGKTVHVTALLVDNVRTAPPEFYQRYESLSARADMITYNGHAGLGSNVRALARRGHFVPKQYVIFFMNGCDTFAYVDGALAETRAAINPDDPTGTKYMEIVTNIMPSYFRSMPNASLEIMRGLLSYDAPKTYDEIFNGVDKSQVIVVTGEEDNTYTPGKGEGWEGLEETFDLAYREDRYFETPELPAGSYTFTISGSHGDADLYTRVGAQPTMTEYDCRPYKNGSNESCQVTLSEPGKVHVMAFGYAATQAVTLKGAKSSGGGG